MMVPGILVCGRFLISVCMIILSKNCLVKQFAICLVKQFAICLGVVVICCYVMEVFSVGGGAMLDRPCIVFQTMCVLYL